MFRKIEVLANLAIIITSIALCSLLAKKYLFAPSDQVVSARTQTGQSTGSQSKRQIQPGTKITLQGIDWTRSNRTVLLALSTKCRFCTESASFYQKLQQQKPRDVGLIAVFPQPLEDSRNYLNQLGVSVDSVVEASLGSVQVFATPTLILLDENGVVKDSWVGKLPDGEIEKVLNQIVTAN